MVMTMVMMMMERRIASTSESLSFEGGRVCECVCFVCSDDDEKTTARDSDDGGR